MSALSWWDIAGMAVLILGAISAGLIILRADDRDYWAGVDWQLRGCRGQAEAIQDAPDPVDEHYYTLPDLTDKEN